MGSEMCIRDRYLTACRSSLTQRSDKCAVNASLTSSCSGSCCGASSSWQKSTTVNGAVCCCGNVSVAVIVCSSSSVKTTVSRVSATLIESDSARMLLSHCGSISSKNSRAGRRTRRRPVARGAIVTAAGSDLTLIRLTGSDRTGIAVAAMTTTGKIVRQAMQQRLRHGCHKTNRIGGIAIEDLR